MGGGARERPEVSGGVLVSSRELDLGAFSTLATIGVELSIYVVLCNGSPLRTQRSQKDFAGFLLMRHIAFRLLAAELLGSPIRTQVPLGFSKKHRFSLRSRRTRRWIPLSR